MTGQGRDVTLQKLSADWTREILYSLWLCVEIVLQSRTRFLCSKTILEYSEKEPVGVKTGGSRVGGPELCV